MDGRVVTVAAPIRRLRHTIVLTESAWVEMLLHSILLPSGGHEPLGAQVLNLSIGCYVSHAKLPDLGAGEVLSAEKGTVRLRFASGERTFSLAKAEEHLEITQEAPPPAKPSKASRPPRAAKAGKRAASK